MRWLDGVMDSMDMSLPLLHKNTPVSFIISETEAYWKFFDRLKRHQCTIALVPFLKDY